MNRRVLLVESDARETSLADQLRDHEGCADFELTAVGGVDEAARLIAKRSFDVLLLDLGLPDASTEVLHDLQEVAAGAPIVVIGDLDQEALALRAIQSGAQDYLLRGRHDTFALRRTLRYAIERKQTEDALSYMAHHDPLTGLPNRNLFKDRLIRALARAKRSGELVGVLFLDVDRFKRINDLLGHAAGDELLRSIAKRVGSSLRSLDTVARVGGDEFVVVLEGLNSKRDAMKVARKLQREMERPFDILGEEIRATVSVGLSLHQAGGAEPAAVEHLLQEADTAMYRAKRDGRNKIVYFEPQMQCQDRAGLRMEADLRRAIEENELTLAFQPQVEMTSGRVVGLEALVRWRHPDLGLVHPGDFVPAAEESGQIEPLGRWVLTHACEQLARWHGEGLGALRVGVNVAAAEFRGDGLVRRVERALLEHGLPAGSLELELTERTLFQEDEAGRRTLADLREMGVRLAIDDFGTGYSSLEYLRRIPVDVLKIDRTFVRGLGKDEDDERLASAILGIARALRVEALAEGVETEAQLAFLRGEGYDLMQGYYASRPVPAEEVPAAIERIESGAMRMAAG